MDNGFLTNELIEIEPPGNISLSSKENLVIIISTLQLTSLLYSPVKDKNSKLATSTKEQLEVWHNHYKKLVSSHSDINSALIEWSNKFSNGTIRYTRHNEWDINQDISIEEIKEAILATPNYKASGPDGIPIEFYIALIPPDEENSVK